jgi:hypothetical protein
MSYRRTLFAITVLILALGALGGLGDPALAQPGSSTPIIYEGELRPNETGTGSVNAGTGQNWDFWLGEVTAGVAVEITVMETTSPRTDVFVYQGAGSYPSGSVVAVLGPVLDQNTGYDNPKTLTFVPAFNGPVTIVIESDYCCDSIPYEITGTGLGGAGLVDLVAPGGFFELGQRLTLSVVLSDSSLSRTPGDVSKIAGIDFKLMFDPSLVTVDSVTLGDDVSSWFLTSNLTVLGEAHVALSSMTPFSAIFAQLEVVKVHFRAVGTRGDVTVSIQDSNIFDDTPTEIDHGTIQGVLIVGCDAGDVVKTGDVNTADTIKTLRFATLLDEATTEEFCAADINNDELIDTADAVLNLRRVVGLPREAGTGLTVPDARITKITGRTAVDLTLIAAAGLQSVVTYDPAVLRFRRAASFDGGLSSVNATESGVVRIAAVTPTAGDRSLRLVFDRIGPGDTKVRATSLRAFDVQGIGYESQGPEVVTFQDRSADPFEPRLPKMGIVSAGPNPFNPRIEFGLRVSAGSDARLDVYDLRGRRVRSMAVRPTAGGESRVIWDGTDESGRRLASGVYHVRLVSGEVVDQVRVLLLK